MSTGVIQGLLVYEKDELIGRGWIIYDEKWKVDPLLVDLTGKCLPTGFYTLVVSNESFLIVVNRSVH
jgi:hypothetical protein